MKDQLWYVFRGLNRRHYQERDSKVYKILHAVYKKRRLEKIEKENQNDKLQNNNKENFKGPSMLQSTEDVGYLHENVRYFSTSSRLQRIFPQVENSCWRCEQKERGNWKHFLGICGVNWV